MDDFSPKEVMLAVSTAIKNEGLTRAAAAQRLGMKPSTLSNLLSTKKYLSPKQAERFYQAFGFNKQFLMSGKGELREPEQEKYIDSYPKYIGTKFKMNNSPTDMNLVLSWFREAFSKRGDNLGLALWAEVSRYVQTPEIVRKDIGYENKPAPFKEYATAMDKFEANVISRIKSILQEMEEK